MHSSAFQNVYRQKNQKCNKLIWIPPNNYRCIISNVLILISRQICVGVSYKHFVRFVFIFWIKYRININWNENKAEIISIASQWLCSRNSVWAIKWMLFIFRTHCFWTLFLSRIIMFMRFSPEKKNNTTKKCNNFCATNCLCKRNHSVTQINSIVWWKCSCYRKLNIYNNKK